MSATWVGEGEKYGLVAMNVKAESIQSKQISPNLWVVADTVFSVPTLWREWLGSIRADEIESSDLFLLSKISSKTLDVMDDENRTLTQRAWQFYAGLLLTSPFAPAHRPVMLTGSWRDGVNDLRQTQDFDSPAPSIFRAYPLVRATDLKLAAELAGNLDALNGAPLADGHWRFYRTLSLYTEARTIGEIIERLHQYCRCIEGLILPAPGGTKRQFRSKTELFIGPRYHDLMGEIYDVRSAVEHLHESRYLEGFDRATRLDLVKKEAIAEHVARTALARIVSHWDLWPHFANTSGLANFWGLPAVEQQRIWGPPIDPMDAIADLDPSYIHDGILGGP
jgi:hypothetical protein